MPVVDPSYRLLACQYLDEQLQVLMQELSGVRRNDDIEPIHQARVASRRIRAALTMFLDCFDLRKAAQWPKRIRKLTRELGAARDKDVQIEFVGQFLETLDAKDRKNRPGVERLLLRLQQSRQALQAEVIRLLDKLEKAGTLAQMYGQMEKNLFILKSRATPVSSSFAREATRVHIRDRKAGLVACEKSFDDPQDILGHHQMRIEAKKLRYTCEISNPVYVGRLTDFIAVFKQVQSLLGDIHDCDVWVQDVDAFMEHERLATITYYGHAQPFNRLKPGLLLVQEDRAENRRRVFEKLVKYWKALDAEQFWDRFEEVLKEEDSGNDAGREAESKKDDCPAQ
jgi:CHAD domain-containing protein